MKKDFSYPIPVDMIAQKEKRYSIEASVEDNKSIAEILMVPAVNHFSAKYVVKGYKKSTLIEVSGEYSAKIMQNCIITLEDFEKEYSGEFSVMYDSKLKVKTKDDEECDIAELDSPEVVYGNEIDLVHVALEQIALALDDYPRKEGAKYNFKPEFTEDDLAKERKNPFDILASLKK